MNIRKKNQYWAGGDGYFKSWIYGRAKVVQSLSRNSSTSNLLCKLSSTLITSSTMVPPHPPATWPSYKHCTPPLQPSTNAPSTISIIFLFFFYDQIHHHTTYIVLCFEEYRQKTLTSIFFQKHRWNISSFSKSMMFYVMF